MNNLSWLIYLADVCDNIDLFFWWIMMLAILGTAVWALAGFIMVGDDCAPSSEDWKLWRNLGFKLALPCLFVGVVLGSIVPEKETIYAIAASEMGETALNTETGSKAVKALNHWLDRQMTEEEEGADAASR